MLASSFRTLSVVAIPGQDPEVITFAAREDRPVFAMVRAPTAGGFLLAHELEALIAADNVFPSGGYQLPGFNGDGFVMAPGQKIYALATGNPGDPISIARMEAPAGAVRGARGRGGRTRTFQVGGGLEPLWIAKARDDCPARVVVCNRSRGSDVGLCEEEGILLQNPLRGYRLPANTRDSFILAPGQTLYAAVAVGGGNVTISVIESDAVDEDWILETL